MTETAFPEPAAKVPAIEQNTAAPNDDSGQAPAPKPATSRFGPRMAAPIAVLLLSVGLLVASVARFNAFSAGCPSSFTPDGWVTGGFTSVVGAFLLGGLLGSFPHKRAGREVASLTTQVGLTALVLILTVAWWYETRAVAANSSDILPITHFVMCIKHYENDWTLLVFILAGLLAGRWLWHRPGAYLQ